MGSDNYYNRNYNINPKIRELIESRIGKQFDMSYVEAENIIERISKCEYVKPIRKYTTKDIEKLMSILGETSPNRMSVDVIDTIVLFLTDNFDDKQSKRYLEYCIGKYYKPGLVYDGVRISNRGIITLVEKSGVYDLKDGVIINKKFIGDLIPVFGETTDLFNQDEAMIKDDLSDDLEEIFNQLKLGYDVDYYMNDDIFIITSNNEETTKYMKQIFDGLEIQKVLDFSYYEKNEEAEESTDSMDLGNGIIMKGNFTNMGNIGGTQVIGVGSGSGNSLLDQLVQEDAMEKLNKIMNGDMSGFGHDEDEDSDLSSNTNETNDNGGNGNNGGKIDCNDPNYPNRSILERIFASDEWKETYLPNKLKNPNNWGGIENMYDELDDSDVLLSNPKIWKENHSWDSSFVHPNAKSFQGQKVEGFYYVVCGSTDRDINIFMIDDEIIGWFYHED